MWAARRAALHFSCSYPAQTAKRPGWSSSCLTRTSRKGLGCGGGSVLAADVTRLLAFHRPARLAGGQPAPLRGDTVDQILAREYAIRSFSARREPGGTHVETDQQGLKTRLQRAASGDERRLRGTRKDDQYFQSSWARGARFNSSRQCRHAGISVSSRSRNRSLWCRSKMCTIS